MTDGSSLPACSRRGRARVPSWLLLAGLAAFGACGRAGAITVSEIHYDPPGSDSGLEFVEILNDNPTVADVSGWAFTDGVAFTFPPGTFIPAGGHAVVCADETAFRTRYGDVEPIGVFEGRLDSDGEALVLSNAGGGEELRVRYSYRGKWPAVPAGTGHTLSLLRPHLDASEPESWGASLEPGGTPGRANFPTARHVDTEVVRRGATWTYKSGTEEFSSPQDAWRGLGFVPGAGWVTGPTGIGYGDNDDATILDDMPNRYISVAARIAFSIDAAQLEDIDVPILAIDYDDGFVAYLNGTEVARSGIAGNPGAPVPFDATAASHEAGVEEEFRVPRELLRAGTNVLAVQGHNASIGSSDFSLAPRLLRRKILDPAGSASTPVSFNELLGRTSGPRWVELHNAGSIAIDLSGYFLSDSADALDRYRLPEGSAIPSLGFLVVAEASCGLDLGAPEVRLFLSRPDLSAVVAGEVFANAIDDRRPASREGTSDARLPDGSGPFGFALEPTPGAPNRIDVERDIVINEILYHPPIGNPAGEFVELHNRGPRTVDVGGWAFAKGIDFVFPEGTAIPPGGYIVVAGDPAGLEAAHGPGALGPGSVLGPWTGALSNGGENLRLVDSMGNTADEVRYYDGGLWSEWADGGGSSLELIDPWQDNSFGTAWAPSDESEGSVWTQTTYTASYVPEAESELHFLLLDSGAVRLDEISLRRAGSATEHIANGGFETGTAPWRLLGTHVSSARITSDSHAGNACLELRSTGPGDNNLNKIETDTTQVMTSGTYVVSFRARWVRGANKLLVRADSMTGASLSRTIEVPVPAALGTPGRENGARAALRRTEPSGNLGPVIGDVSQDPVAPSANQTVTVRARAHDSDGIASLSIRYRTGGVGDGVFAEAAMHDDGAHDDGRPDDGIFAGELPGFPQGTRVVFYLEGRDARGAVRRFPVEAPARTLVYAVESAVSSSVFISRLSLTDEDVTTLQTRPLHSDDLIDATFVLNDEQIYYQVGVRYHGSPWNRPPNPRMYRVRFNEDRPFIRNLRAVNLSRYGSAQNEGTAYLCVQSASTPWSPAPAGEYIYTRATFNAASLGLMALVETVDGRYVERWFPRDPDGHIFKIPGRRYFNDANQLTEATWTTFQYRGSMSDFGYEAYRWYFVPSSGHLKIDWSPLVALCSIMDVSRTGSTEFDARIEDILDVEQFLRVEATRTLQDDWDTIGIGNGQNAYIYFAPLEGRWKLLPWDMDHTFGNVDAKLYPEGSEAQITRLIQRPTFRRIYLRILSQLLSSTWDPAYTGRYLDETRATTGIDGTAIRNFIASRRARVAAQIPSTELRLTAIGSTTVPAGWAGEHVTARTSERLRGTAPVDVATLLVFIGEAPADVPVSWVSVTSWSLDLPLAPGENRVQIVGYDAAGTVAGSQSFAIRSTTGAEGPTVAGVDPVSGSSYGGDPVRIAGTGFRVGARVFFGAAESVSVSFVSPTELIALSSPGAGRVPVRVQNPDALWGELASAFEYIDPVRFIRGDANLDGTLDIGDPIAVLGFLFLGGSMGCLEAGDFDDDGALDISDAVSALNFLFLGGPEPAEPYPDPGPDPDGEADGMGCAVGI